MCCPRTLRVPSSGPRQAPTADHLPGGSVLGRQVFVAPSRRGPRPVSVPLGLGLAGARLAAGAALSCTPPSRAGPAAPQRDLPAVLLGGAVRHPGRGPALRPASPALRGQTQDAGTGPPGPPAPGSAALRGPALFPCDRGPWHHPVTIHVVNGCQPPAKSHRAVLLVRARVG